MAGNIWNGGTAVPPVDPNEKNPPLPVVNNMGVTPTPTPTPAPAPQSSTPLPTPTAPPAQPPAPANPPPPMTQQQGVDAFQQWAQSRYGRQATGQELQTIAGRINYTGGDLSQQQLSQAQQVADEMARAMGWQGPAGTPAAPQAPAPQQQMQDAATQRLIQMLTAGDTVDPNSPAMAAQRNTFARANQQGTERARLAASERAAARGTLNTGGYDASQVGLEQQAAGRQADYEAGLMAQELQGQRDRTMQALQLAQQAGLAGEARQLQERLANLDATLRREGYNLQGQLGRGQLALGYLNAMLNNQQANNALGFNYTALQNSANQQAMQNLLLGLNVPL